MDMHIFCCISAAIMIIGLKTSLYNQINTVLSTPAGPRQVWHPHNHTFVIGDDSPLYSGFLAGIVAVFESGPVCRMNHQTANRLRPSASGRPLAAEPPSRRLGQ